MHFRHILKDAKKVPLPSAGWYVFTLLLFSGFLTFEVVRLSYAQEAFKYPTKAPPYGNPEVSSGGSGGTYDPCSAGIFQGFSTEKYEKGIDYIQADKKCDATFSGSHVCSTSEMQRTIQCKPDLKIFDDLAQNNTNEEGWINNGPSISATIVNDCEGWSLPIENYPSVTKKGAIWFFKKGASKYGWGMSKFCKELSGEQTILRNFMCCK